MNLTPEFRSAKALAGLGTAPDPAADPQDALYAPIEYNAADARGQAGEIAKTASRLDELGFDGGKLLAPALDVLAQANAHRETIQKYRDSARLGLWQARQDYANGKTDLEMIDHLAAKWDRISESTSTLSRSLNAAVAIKLQESERVYSETLSSAVFPELAKAATKAAEDAAEAAAKLPAGVRTREDARRAGRAAAGVWADLGNLVDRFGDLQKLRNELTTAGSLPSWEGRAAHVGSVLMSNVISAMHLWLSHAEPGRLPTHYYDTDAIAIELRLPTAVASGSRPSLYTVAEAQGNFLTWRDATERLAGKRVPDGQGGTYEAAIQAVQSLPGVLSRYDGVLGTRTVEIAAPDPGVHTWQHNGSGVGK